jgi:hypothetical protein
MRKWILPIILMEVLLSLGVLTFSCSTRPITGAWLTVDHYTVGLVNNGDYFFGFWSRLSIPDVCLGFYNDGFPFLQINFKGNIFILSL